ncbi:hypothetical protein ROS1_57330 [Roseibium sp. ROS1]
MCPIVLLQGQYFFSDIHKEGIVLYELDDEPLAEPQPLTARERYEVAKGHFEERFKSALSFQKMSSFGLQQGLSKNAAFQLHQTVENAYTCVLLTLTNYTPAAHNIKFLRGLAEGQCPPLAEAWPRDEQRLRAWLGERTQVRLDLIRSICETHLDRLRRVEEVEERQG